MQAKYVKLVVFRGKNMKCLIGLGNIGKEYEYTRHNMGFMCIDKLAQDYNISFDKKLKKSIYAETNIKGEKVLLVKPTTFMNLSGEAVVEIINWFKLSLEDICILYDDVDLPFGKIRYRGSGSAGTHNGMRNIIALAGSESIKRVRVGIETRTQDTPIPLFDYVLGKFSKEEIEKFQSEIYPEIKKIVEGNIL